MDKTYMSLRTSSEMLAMAKLVYFSNALAWSLSNALTRAPSQSFQNQARAADVSGYGP
jgi:hypothetical protein